MRITATIPAANLAVEHMKPSRILFALPAAGISGGVKVVFQHANYLAGQGHTVTIAYPGVLKEKSGLRWQLEAMARQAKYGVEALFSRNEGAAWFPLHVPLKHVPSLASRYLPEADFVVATGLETAEWVAKLPDRHGKKAYFIQDVEDWVAGESAALASWHLPMKIITISSTLKAVADRIGVPVHAVVPNGIDPDIFFVHEKPINEPPVILMLSHVDERKGIPDGLAAVAKARERFPNTVFRMFGAFPPRADMPEGTEYFLKPTQEQLREIYTNADIFLSPSHKEGCQLPPMEAMACGCALVATNVGGVPDYCIPDKTALVVPPHNPDALAQALIRLLEDKKLRADLGKAGRAHITSHFTLETSSKAFAKALLSI